MLFARRLLEPLDTARRRVPKSRMPLRKRAQESTRRTNHIRVRLRPAPAMAVEVTLSDDEVAAVDRAVARLGFKEDGRSALFRAIAWHAAKEYATTDDAEQVFRAAAGRARMGIGEWLRWVTLGAIGESDFCAQLAHAVAFVQAGKVEA
jgi:hypothetical protein